MEVKGEVYIMANKGQVLNVKPLKTREEIQEMKEALRLFCSERDYFLFVLGINTGLRISDLLKLKVKNVREKQRIRVREGKTGKGKEVYIGHIEGEVELYTRYKEGDEWLFPSRKGEKPISTTQAYRALAKAGDMIGRDDIGTHTMRKTFGYHHYQRHKDIMVLVSLFNHSAPSITKRYIGIDQDEIESTLDFVL